MDAWLYKGASNAALTRPQRAQLHALATAPPPAAQRARLLGRGLGLVAALMLGTGLIFWVAANWPLMGRVAKLGLIQAALALCVVVACVWPRARTGALLTATLVQGGLLAYVGQTYQTGADAWQLIAVRAGLSLVWVVTQRSDLLWTVWVGIAALALALWTGRAGLLSLLQRGWAPIGWDEFAGMGLWLVLAAVPWLVSRLPLTRLPQGLGWWSHRLAVTLALASWTSLALGHLLMRPSPTGTVVLALALIGGVGAVAWHSRWRDLTTLALAVFAAQLLLFAVVVRALQDQLDEPAVWLLLSLLAIAALATSASGLFRLQQRWHAQEVSS